MAAPSSGFGKAVIRNLRTNDPILCMFKPKELSVNKTNTWTAAPKKEENVPHMEFGGGQPADLKMQLLFDTYETGKDVRTEYTDKVWKLMEVKTIKNKQEEPPRCKFEWGNYHSFIAGDSNLEWIVESINQKFTLFLSDGTPVRSTMDVTFKQAPPEPKKNSKKAPQNPTTSSKPGYRTRRVHDGELLDWIAFEEYGESKQWRFLADVNGLEDPMSLKTGMILAIPPLD